MLRDCIELCPDVHWDGPIGKHPFWLYAYHTLCYTDPYCAISTDTWRPSSKLHPNGRQSFSSWNPGRSFERAELLNSLDVCRKRFRAALDNETLKSLSGPSGFSWVKIPRYELYPCSTRHVQHHVGQLSAFLRRLGIAPKWVYRARS
jgi:hypothetical protein